MKRRLFSVTLALAVLAGCALKTPPTADEVRTQALPGVALPERWRAGEAAAGAVTGDWLGTFNDPQLDALVQEALDHNPDLQLAAARVEKAAAYVESASAALRPQLSGIANISGKSTNSGTLDYAGVFAHWEIDLWGRVRAGRSAAQMQFLSADLGRAYAQQSIAATVARAWFLATEARGQQALAEASVDASARLVDLARDRHRVGIGSEYEVTVAAAALATSRDGAAQASLALQQAVQSLEVLVGRYPAAELAVPAALPALPGPVPAGLPSELLERRPDVVAAERRVAAAFHRIQETRAARLPTLSLTGSVSSLSSDLVVLKERDDPVWGLGGRATVPLYLGGSLQAQARVRTAEQKEAVAEYGRAGANAFADVERALSSGFALDARHSLLSQAVADNRKAAEFAETRYRVGSDDLRAVEQQQLRLQAAQAALLRVQGEQLVQRVNLHLALGGGFASGEP